jgi:transposase
VLPWLRGYSLSGMCKALQRLNIPRKRGRLCVHSPDPQYHIKMRWIEQAQQKAKEEPDKVVVLYADELSFYRRPELAGGGVYHPAGEEPSFLVAPGYNTRHRLGGALDMHTGRVVWVQGKGTRQGYKARVQGKVVGKDALCLLLTKVRAAYEADTQLFVVWDNWPVHWQADVLTKANELNIHLLWLPTYAPWTNPIEKLWRWLKQSVLHNHQLAEHFDTLKEHVRTFLDQFTLGSPDPARSADLLRYVGLSPLPD